MTFNSIEEAERFKKDNFEHLNDLTMFVEDIHGVQYSDVWLNRNCPSFVAGFNQHDEMVVCALI